MSNKKDSLEVVNRHYERIKQEQLKEFSTISKVEELTIALKETIAKSGIGEQVFEKLSTIQSDQRSELQKSHYAQRLNAQQANADLSAPKVDLEKLEENHRNQELVLCRNHVTELFSFRDNYVTASQQFSRNADIMRDAEKEISTPDKSID